jgi:FtsP/CotA-like multicopper oxidase with cupredoxin domain
MIGPFTLVDGGIWPHHEVEPRQYRLRLLNGAATRWNTMTTT